MLNDTDVNFWEAVSEVKNNIICERELKKNERERKQEKKIRMKDKKNSLEEITNERIPFALCTFYIF